MQINSVARHLLAPLGSGPSSNGSDASSNTASLAELGRDDDLAVDGGGGFHQILSEYDMQSITPRQFGELIDRLHKAGEIDDNELRQLSRVRVDLEQAGMAPNAPIDLLAFLERREAAAQSKFDLLKQDGSSDDATIDAAELSYEDSHRQLQWVRKFDVVHAAGSQGIDAGA